MKFRIVAATAVVLAAGLVVWALDLPRVAAQAPAEPTDDSKPPAKKAGDIETFGGIEFVWCPPDEATLGTAPADIIAYTRLPAAWFSDEPPARERTIARGFWISRTEITRSQWINVVGALPADIPDARLELPVTRVSLVDCRAFAERLAAAEGGAYRLPTETEWEYACRAGATGIQSFDPPEALPKFAWCRANVPDGRLQPTGKLAPNPWGLFDTLGNAWEWCDTVYAAPGRPPVVETAYVIRGGSVKQTAPFVRPGYRHGFDATQRHARIGFRLVREPDTE